MSENPYDRFRPQSDASNPYAKYAASSIPAVKPAEAPKEDGDFVRGLKRTLPELKQLAGGTMAAVGDVTGWDGLRDKGLDIYKAQEVVVAPLVKPTDSATEAWKELKRGNLGAGADFVQNAAGYVTGQALESLTAAGAGAAIGGAVGSAAPGAGNVAGAGLGAIGGFVAKQGVKRAVKDQAEKLVEKQLAEGATKQTAKQAGKDYVATHAAKDVVAGQVGKQFTQQQLRKKGGQVAGALLGAQGLNTVFELGSVYPEALHHAREEGRELTRGEQARAVGASLAAAGLESAADLFALSKLFRGVKDVGQTVAGDGVKAAAKAYGKRAAVASTEGAIREAGTEAAQTFLERYGAQQSLNDEDAWRDYIDSAAVGAVGGILFGGVAGFHRRGADGEPSPQSSRAVPGFGADPADQLRAAVLQARSPKEKAAAAQTLYDHLAAEGRLLAPADTALQVNPAGEAATASQIDNMALQAEQAALDTDLSLSQQRNALGLTTDVNEARAAHPGAIPNQQPVPFPDAAPGSLASAANTLATAAPTLAAPLDPDEMPAWASMEGAPEGNSLADLRQWTPDQIRAHLDEQLAQGAVLPKPKLMAEVFGIPERDAIALHHAAVVDARGKATTQAREQVEADGRERSGENEADVEETRRGLEVDRADLAHLRESLAKGLDPNTGKPITSAGWRSQFETEAANLEIAVSEAERFLSERNAAPAAAATTETAPAVGAVQAAAAEAATSPENTLPEPSAAQKEAGNYKVGRLKVAGLDVSVEFPAGVKRDPKHTRKLTRAYGRIRRTEGADGEHVDVFLGERAEDASLPVFVVDQTNAQGAFDEHKVVMGEASEAAAREAYLSNYPKGWKGLGGIRQMTQAEFKAWVRDPKATKAPASPSAEAAGTDGETLPGKAPSDGDVPRAPAGGVPRSLESGFLSNSEPSSGTPAEGAAASAQDTPADADLTTERKRLGVPRVIRKSDAVALLRREAGMSQFEAERAFAEIDRKGLKEGTRLGVDVLAAVKARATASEKRAVIDEWFAANRQALKEEGFKKGDAVSFQSGDRTLSGIILSLGDKEQAVVAVGVKGKRGVADYHVPAAELARAAPDAAADVEAVKSQAAAAPVTLPETAAQQAKKAPGKTKKKATGRSKSTPKPTVAKGGEARTLQSELFRAIGNDPAMAGKSVAELEAALTEQAAGRLPASKIPQLARALAKDMKRRAAELEKEKHRDPATRREALRDALGAAYPDTELAVGERRAFVQGFEHALKGKTKSSLSGQHLEDSLKGYAAARAWIKTEVGKAYYEGRPAKKLQNTGVDLRRWYEQRRNELASKESDGKKLWTHLKKMTTRADLFPIDPPEGASPGTTRFLEYARDQAVTFADYLANWTERNENGFSEGQFERSRPIVDTRRSRYMGPVDKRIGDFIERMIGPTSKYTRWADYAAPATEWVESQESHLRGYKFPPSSELSRPAAREKILQVARDYLDDMQALHDALSSATSAQEVADAAAGFHADNEGAYQRLLMSRIHGKERRRDPLENRSYSRVAHLIDIDEVPIKQGARSNPLTPPRLDRVTREGLTDRRKGKDVTPQQFKAAFGFADVGFGKWVGARQDQDHLNYAYDAFMDLAEHFGIPPKLIGLGGELHFTIGALGHGKFAAHFQAQQPHPDGGTVPVINVTNTRGDGTVYHEWAHAFDLHGATGDWPRVRAKILHALKRQPVTPESVEKRALEFLTGGHRWSRGRYTNVEGAIEALSDYQFKRYTPTTTYYRNAQALDGSNKKDPYWSNDKELFARAIEAWSGDTLGGANTYLVNPAWSGDGAATKEKGYRGTPYPRSEERKHFNEVLGALAKSVSVKDGKLHVSLAEFDKHYTDPNTEGEARRKSLLEGDNMQAFYESVQAQQQEAQDEKARAEQAEADRLAAEALAELEAALPETMAEDTQGPLDEADLEALFDEAAAELRESTQEQPDAPAPGEAVAKLAAASTPVTGTKPAASPLSEAQAKTARALAAEAAKQGVTGVDEAMQGLVALFGGGKGRLNSFPAGFDQEAYAAALPHFKKALAAFQAAGKSLKDLFKFLIQNFGDGIKMYAVQFAKDEGLTTQLGEQPSASMAVAAWVEGQLARGQAGQITWQQLFREADTAFGGTQAEGKYTPKDAYDALEAGVNRYIMARRAEFSPDTSPEGALLAIDRLEKLIGLIPAQTKRTAETDSFQQFSTIPPFAFMANWVANVGPGDVVLEPSAGIGGLAVFARAAGAELVLNELSSRRAAVLQEVFPSARVFHENAEQIDNILPDDVQPSVVVMNPPFSSSAGRLKANKTAIGAQHVEQALDRLAPGGRLVAIVGDGMRLDAAKFRDWWLRIQKTHDVRAVVPVSGKGYAKYGTTFDQVLLVIDKVAPTPGRTPLTTPVEAYNQLPGLLSEIRNDRPAANVASRPDRGAQRDRAESARNARDEEGEGSESAGATDAAQPAGVGRGEPLRGQDARADGAGRNVPRAARGGVRGARRPADAPGANDDGAVRSAGEPDGGPDGRPESADTGLTITAADTASGELTDSVFEGYHPQRLQVPGAKAHPGPLVQSSALASVQPPAPAYTPNLPAATVQKGKLSLAQVEAVVYAGAAHQQTLPNGDRRGFFIGDGTGVGKGREISGILLDNLRQGRTKAVWMTEKQGLLKDAKRDFQAVGGDPGLLFNQGKAKAGDSITESDGILFTTYATLRSGAKKQKKGKDGETESGQSRLDQLVAWLGKDFDGVLVFDEAHNAGNAVPIKGKRGVTKPSAQAIAVVDLQAALPNARVVYVSATGATEVANLSYTTRLGLWGEGTAFASVQEFIAQMTAGGLSAMELVARDMKQMGAYLARSLSYEGVSYSRVEHELSPLQTDIYNRLAEAWQVVLQNFNEALEAIGAVDSKGVTRNSDAVSAAKSAFWGGQQRFFNQVITSMQMPSVIAQMERDIAAGDALVLQLVNTNEAQQERAMAKRKTEEEQSLEDLDLTPRDMLLQMVEGSFPVVQMEQFEDEEGRKRSRPVTDSTGKPVENKKAVAMRDNLLKDLQDIKVPDGPLEMVLNHFGPDVVAEVTGRGQRIVRKPDANGQVVAQIEKRGPPAARADADAFMEDQKQVLVFSDAGGTGFSFHADLTRKNQRKRKHYLIQPGWRADKAVQGFGRTHRTNQKSAPHYYLAATNIPAHKRFLSSIARKLDQLGALTSGQRDTANQGLFSEKDNLESVYATQAVRQLFEDAQRGTVPDLPFMAFLEQMGLENILDKDTGKIGENNMPAVSQFLNRMLSLKLDMQERVFDAFMQRMEEKVETAIARGEFDGGMQTIKALEVAVEQEETIYTDPRTEAETKFMQLALTLPNTFYAFPPPSKYSESEYVVNEASGRVWLKVKSGTATLTDGRVVDKYQMRGTGGSQTKKANEIYSSTGDLAHYKVVTQDEARALWEKENAARPPTVTRTSYLITGAILPVWDRLQTGSTHAIEVVRTQTKDGRRLLGRQLRPGEAREVRNRFEISSAAASAAPADVLRAVLSGQTGTLANGWTLARAKVSDSMRIELNTGHISGPAQAELERMGLILERINWKERFFVPTGADGVPVLTRLLESKPLLDLADADDARLKRSPRTAGMPARAVRAVVSRLRAGNADIKVVQSYADLPASVRAMAEAQGAAPADVRAAFSGSTSYLVADNLADAAEARAAVFHEAFVHGGMRRRYGNRIEARLQQLAKGLGGREGVLKAAKEQGIDLTAYVRGLQQDARLSEPRRLAILTEELIAHVAETSGTLRAFLEEVIGMIRAFLRHHGLAEFAELGVTDLRAEIRAARAAVLAGEAVQTAAAPAFAREGQAEPFYSALLESVAIGKGAPKRGNPTSWKGWLDGAQRRGEFRQAERDWLGLDAWLAGRATTTREELAAFVRANEVQVQDVVLGGNAEADMEAWWNDEGGANEETPFSDLTPSERADAEERYREEVMDYQEDGPKFAQWQLPGGENYRELLLTLPPTINEVPQWKLIRPDGHVESTYVSEASARIQAERRGEGYTIRQDAPRTAEGGFRSAHFDQPNILAHVRFNERTDADGKRVLFLEEIQSDWHQAGRKRGYATSRLERPDTTGWRAEVATIYDAPYWRVFTAAGQQYFSLPREDASTPEAAIAAAVEQRMAGEGNANPEHRVPDAPFKATDEWAMLAFKRMVRYAAENGFDRIAWTTGEQQADRYDLSKHVDAVRYTKSSGGMLLIKRKGSQDGWEEVASNVEENQLSDHIGKEAAEKIAGMEFIETGGVQAKTLSGLDLKVGGEGMRAFYDKILPAAVNKWAKRFGGRVASDKVRIAPLGVAGSQKRFDDAHAIDLTPAMRDAALAGQPLFSRQRDRGTGLDYDRALQLKRELTAKWGENAPTVIVVRDAEGFPDDAKVDPDYRRGEGFYNGRPTVWINAGAIRTEQRFAQVLAHEALGHFGVEQIVGTKDWNGIVDTIHRHAEAGTGAQSVRDAIADVRRRYGALSRVDFAKEVIAVMAEQGTRNGLVDRVVAAVRRWLRIHMPSLQWSDRDIVGLLGQADSFLHAGRTNEEARASVRALAFSQGGSVRGMRTLGIPPAGGEPRSVFRNDHPLKAHARYQEAKAGDADAAIDLVAELAQPLVDKTAAFGPDVIYLAPHAVEASGENAIPQTLAAFLADAHGARSDSNVVQRNKVYHTGADAMQRLIAPSEFVGDVEPGGRYVLVDDVTTMGGTLSDLASFIRANGGEVVGAVTLVNAARGGKIHPAPRVIQQLQRRYGDEIRSEFGIEPSALTAEEAQYLIGFRTADELRGRAASAKQARTERLRSKGIRLEAVDDSPAPPSAGPDRSGPANPDTDLASGEFTPDTAFVAGLTPAERKSSAITGLARALWQSLGVESPFFQDWFGDSKVVDGKGAPAPVYHGTAEAFDAFAEERLSSSTGHMSAGLGFFFASKKKDAEAYAAKAAQGVPADERVIDAYLSIRNPKAMGLDELLAIGSQEQARALKAKLQAEGFDGIHLVSMGWWVAFEAAQVKSTGNRGTFDRRDARMAFSKPPVEILEDIEAVMQAGQGVPLPERIKARLADMIPAKVKDRLRPTWLGALTTRHLTELGSDYFENIRIYSDFLAEQSADRNKLQTEGEAVVEHARKWAGKHRVEAEVLFKIMHDSTIDGVDPSKAYAPLQFRYGGKLLEATPKNVKDGIAAIREQMRGRSGDNKTDMIAEAKMLRGMPGRERRRREKYGPLVERWNQLSPEAQAIYREFRDTYEDRSHQVEEGLVARINDTDAPENQKRKLITTIRLQFETQRLQGVYFPLQRFGRYFVAAEKSGTPTFLMFENLDQTERAVRDLKRRGFTIKAQGLKSAGKAQDAPSGTFVAEVIQAMHKAGVSEKTQDEIYQIYLESLPELSMRKHSIHRQSVPGFDPDAVRAFAFNMHHGAHQLARLRYGHKLQNVLDLLKKTQDDARREEGADTRKIVAGDAILAELSRRHEWINNPQDSQATNLVSSFGFSYYLGLTPAAALVNLSQTALVTYPYLASRYGGVKAMNHLLAGMRDSVRTAGNIQKTLTDSDEQRAHSVLQAMGALDKTQAHNLAGIADGGLQGYNPAWAKAMEIVGWGFHKAEVANREASGMAAFRLARAAGESFDQAVKIAADTIHDTHFDYTNANRARFMQNGTAKVLLMFRQYSLNMTWHLGRMAWQATKGQTPEVKKLARRNLAGVLGMTSLFAGVLGLPLMSVTMGVLNAIAASFGDDDEPWEAETEFRAFLVDMLGEPLAQTLLKGPANQLTGADVASRVSLSELWFRDADRELEGRGAYYHLLEQAAGPMGGVLKNALVGKQLMDDGHLMRGIETTLPKGIKDSLKAGRYATQGVNNLRGDPVVQDLSLWETLLQAQGFTPAAVAEQYDRNRALKNYEKSILDRRSHLMDAFAMSLRLGDTEARREVIRKIQRFNAANPAIAITTKSIRTSIGSRARYSARAEGGIVLNPKIAAQVRARTGLE